MSTTRARIGWGRSLHFIQTPAVLLLLCFGLQGAPAGQSPVTLSIDAAKPGARINPAMWGVFFEDINFGADGGLSAEMVKNRSFEFTQPLMGWSKLPGAATTGKAEVLTVSPLNANNSHFLRISAGSPGGTFGLINEGFSGMAVKMDEFYRFTVYARSLGIAPKWLRIELSSPAGFPLGGVTVSGFTPIWQQYTASFPGLASEAKARLSLIVDGPGVVDVDMVSLFPTHTWKNRPNGLRADLVQMLDDLKPGFVRFPGGCIVEGHYLSGRYQWKTTIGKPEERKLIINRWNDEFKHRPAPDYFQSFALGFFEYFQLCEDIGAQPLPILNCGMACQFNSKELAPLKQLQPYIQDALDLIEFANGPANTPHGARRAAMGHPNPFGMQMLGVGNEQWGPEYIERYVAFAKVLKEKHPEIQLISSAGPSPDDDRFNFLWPKLRELKADIIDEHCYATPDWFFNNAARYDLRERGGPKVFMGEYAAQSVKVVSPENRNNWECALSEAAYMTGLERNADLVVMSSYAPLFAHVDLWQWRPNLIWFDNERVFGTPNYYVQQLFSRNRGDVVLPVRLQGTPAKTDRQVSHVAELTGTSLPARFYASATRDEKEGEIILKVVNAAPQAVQAAIEVVGVKKIGSKGKAILLTSQNLKDENTLDAPKKIAPLEQKITRITTKFQHVFSPHSFSVLRIPTTFSK